MKLIPLFFASLLLPITIGYTQPLDTLWTKIISSPANLNARAESMIKYSDNEFIVVGNYEDFLYVLKVNSNGQIIWQKQISLLGTSLYGAGLDKDSFGNIYIIVWNLQAAPWMLFKMNELGETIWVKTISDQNNNFNVPYTIKVNNNHIFVGVGVGMSQPDNFGLYKFNLDGDSIFVKILPLGANFCIPKSLTIDSEGNIILVGTGGSGWGIMKCNSDGDTLWTKLLFSNGQEARDVITDLNNNIIVTGSRDKLLKFDPNGNLLFSKQLAGTESFEGNNLLFYDPENLFIIGAHRRGDLTTFAFDPFIGKYHAVSGDSVWSFTYAHPDTVFGAYSFRGAAFNDSILVTLNLVYSPDYISSIYLVAFLLNDTPVPVELLSFTATTKIGGCVELNWSTATETNNLGFEIQRSGGGEFEVVGFVAGYGTTTETKTYSFTDKNLKQGKYSYRLKQIDYNGNYEYSKILEVECFPKEYALYQNYPNPFNPTTKINYTLLYNSRVKLNIYNVMGQKMTELINVNQEAGNYEISWDASSLSSGIYFYEIIAESVEGGNNFNSVRKMMLLK